MGRIARQLCGCRCHGLWPGGSGATRTALVGHAALIEATREGLSRQRHIVPGRQETAKNGVQAEREVRPVPPGPIISSSGCGARTNNFLFSGARARTGFRTRDGRKLFKTMRLASRSPGMNQLFTDQR